MPRGPQGLTGTLTPTLSGIDTRENTLIINPTIDFLIHFGLIFLTGGLFLPALMVLVYAARLAKHYDVN